MSAIEEVFKERQAEARELERKAEEARQLESKLRDLRKDLAGLEERQARFAALGAGHLEVPWSQYNPHLGTIEMAPLRSKLSGKELAAGVENELDYLREHIAASEAEIAKLLER